MTELPKTTGDLAPDSENPNVMSSETAEGLAYSMQEFGDLANITFNVGVGELVGGHHRVEQLTEKYGPLQIQALNENMGLIETPGGDSYPVRFVRWDREKHRAALVAANSPTLQGDFDETKLELLLDDIQEHRERDFENLAFMDLLDVEPEGGAGRLVDQKVKPPPIMTWVLVGIPTVKYGEINEAVEALAANPDTQVAISTGDE